MTEKGIDILLKKGENLTSEFKNSFNNEVIETLVAFPNTVGGSVIIGISNDKKTVGVTIDSESVQNWLNEIKNKSAPSISYDCPVVLTRPEKSLQVSGYGYRREYGYGKS